jgi:mannose-6-phosphate isomerase
MQSLYPLLLQPALHVKVWGGRKLADVLGKTLPTEDPYGESWELHDSVTVANGPLAGRTIAELVALYGEDLIGPGGNTALGFPLLAKFLDARDWLSVQVHPNDAQAQAYGDGERGKTEAWYVVQAEPGASLVIGVQPGTTPEAITEAINTSTLEDLLVFAQVQAGDVLFVKTGTIHALGPGLLIYEIQQSSDITYRFYDWGRMGLDGQPRTLHIEKSLAVSTLDSLPQIKHTADQHDTVVPIVTSEFFETELIQLRAGDMVRFGRSERGQGFDALTCIDGETVISSGEDTLTLGLGQTALIPAAVADYQMHGRARVLRSTQPRA